MIQTGSEGKVIWEVTEYRQPVLITIKDKSGNLLEEAEYTCMHEPIFGIDIDDCTEINKILDKLIVKWNKRLG